MCRLTIYKGRPILIGSIVIEPENSLLYQSRDAAYHPGVVDKSNVRNILVNGDGFGISWYGDDPSKGSCCFKFVTPAWSDTNLRNIGRHVASPLIFAHVRAAASGHDPFAPMIVSNENCHPFTYKDYTFMHNGGIPSFQSVKLKLLNLLSPETYANIKGTTDTEHIFALYLNCLPPLEEGQSHSVADMVAAMNQTISIILQLCAEGGITDHCSLNLCVTNGIHIIATRYRSGPKLPPSLYYNFGSKFVCKNGVFYAEEDVNASEIVISSAPLSKVSGPTENCVEVELEVSYTEDDENKTHLPLSPATATGRLRKNNSTNSLRAVLQAEDNAPPLHCFQDTTDTGTDSDAEDIGAWILIPKNHMLVCRGSELAPNKVEAIYLERVIAKTSTAPLVKPLYAGIKRKVSEEQWLLPASLSQYTQALAPTEQHAKRSCTDSVSVTYQQSEDEFSGTTTISASASLTSTEDCADAPHTTAVSACHTDGTGTSCTMSRTVGCAMQSTEVVGPPGCSPYTPSGRHRPKCIKFTCKM